MEGTLGQDVRKYATIALRRRGLIVTCLAVSVLVATLYNYTQRPLYQATTQILIEKKTPQLLPVKDPLVEAGVSDFQTEYLLLSGRDLMERVVAKLELQKSPELSTGPLMSPWERFQRLLGRLPASTVDSQGIPLSPAVAVVRSRLSVEPLPGGRLVNLRFTAYDPSVCAQLANALAEAYIEQGRDLRVNTSEEASEFLTDRLDVQRKKVEDTEKALRDFEIRHSLTGLERDDAAQGDAQALMSARAERMSKEALVGQLRSMSPLQLQTAPLVQASSVVQSLRVRLAELQAEQARLSETLGERHPDIVRLRSELRTTEDRLHGEIQGIVSAAEADYRAARDKEARLEGTLAASKRTRASEQVLFEQSVLKREVESAKKLFDDLKSRKEDTGLQSEMRASYVKIVERAEVPHAPIFPRRERNLQIGIALGLALGIGLALLFEHLDNTFKTPEDIKEQLGLPFLGMVPDVNKPGTANVARRSAFFLKDPTSAVSEAYRVLRTNLIYSCPQERGRVLLVTSANPGEGKTTTVANLGACLAQNAQRVLLVDADLRRPMMHQHFSISKTPGLSDLIVGRCQPSAAIQTTRYKGLHVLPCGYVPPDPAELLGSQSLRQIVAAFREHYDWVLIDSPPVLAISDTPTLTPLVDSIVLIVGAEIARRPAVQRAVDQLSGVGGKVVGVVLNKVDLERNSYYYSQYYGEYYRSYYAEGKRRAGEVLPGPRPIKRA